jgi:uncharacterized protein DUF938
MRRQAPAAARNCQPIRDVPQPHLPTRGLVLEVVTGSSKHTLHFAQAAHVPAENYIRHISDEARRAATR